MKLIEKTPKSMSCILGSCPAVFETDRKTYIVIGKQLKPDQIAKFLENRVGNGETAIEFPKQLLSEIIK